MSLGNVFCAEVDRRTCVFQGVKQGAKSSFAVVAYKDAGKWQFVCSPDVKANLEPRLDDLEAQWHLHQKIGQSWRKATRNFIRKPLDAGHILPALTQLEFQKSLMLLLSKAQSIMTLSENKRFTGDAIVAIYKDLVDHMALDTLLWMAQKDRKALKTFKFEAGRGAALWDSIFHAQNRSGQKAQALEAIEKAITYEDNITRREIALMLQAELEKDSALLENSRALAEMRPLKPHELVRQGMAFMRARDKAGLQNTIDTLAAMPGKAADQYMQRLSGYL
ncbi:MAG: hypothetical protein ACWA40_00180 [Planktomarina sp.]